MTKIAVIGGTGMTSFLRGAERREEDIEYTANGEPFRTKFPYFVGQTPNGVEVVYLNRHSVTRGEPRYKRPDTIDYKAYMIGLKRMGVSRVLATSAVGSANKNVKPGSIVIPSDLFDLTDSDVAIDIGKEYVDMANPFPLRPAIRRACRGEDFDGVYTDGFYACMTKGTTFETGLEIRVVRGLLENQSDGQPIMFGMTVPPEAKLSRILGMKYGCLAIVSNMAAGMGEKISHSRNQRKVREANRTVKRLLLATIEDL